MKPRVFVNNSRFIRVENRCAATVFRQIVVELAGVEPASESALTQISPGADGYFGSGGGNRHLIPLPFPQRKPSRVYGSVASLFMVRAKLTVLTFSTNRRLVPARGPSGQDGQP